MIKDDVERYLAIRHATGFKLRNGARHLRGFASFADARGETLIRTKTALEWAMAGATTSQRDYRIRNINRFARFLRAEDSGHEIPPANAFPCPRFRPPPYIYQPEEIRLVIKHAGQLSPKNSIRPLTYSTLFGLLSCTGLRLSEALSLKMSDITPAGLVIQETKFHKSRLVPLHQTAYESLADYITLRSLIDTPYSHLFLSRLCRPLQPEAARYAFRKVRIAAGIPKQGGSRTPRLQDFRHTFAVRSLQACGNNRIDVYRHMLALQTYLGHASVESTHWYLESTPELMADIADAGERFMYGGSS